MRRRSTRRVCCSSRGVPYRLTPDNTLIRVVLAVDAKQVVGCAVCMCSILENVRAGASVHFDVMVNDIPPSDREALRATVAGSGRSATISLHEVDLTRFRSLLTSKSMSHMTYARLLIDDLLPQDAERCIYVDCDMVVERDITEAWEFPLNGQTVAATSNGDAADTRSHMLRLGLGEPRYFNAGFVVLNLVRWRSLHVSERAMVHAKAHGDRLVLHDQDALNCALQGDWVELPPDWNAGVQVSEWLTAESKAVFHYWGATKPWHADYQGRFRHVFFRYLEKSAYRGYQPWNPLGLGAVLWRLKRRIPHFPAVVRIIRQRLTSARTTSQ